MAFLLQCMSRELALMYGPAAPRDDIFQFVARQRERSLLIDAKGKTIVLELRWAEGRFERMPELGNVHRSSASGCRRSSDLASFISVSQLHASAENGGCDEDTDDTTPVYWARRFSDRLPRSCKRGSRSAAQTHGTQKGRSE